MKITNHKLEGVQYVESPNCGGKIEPKFIVQHYTAGYNAESAVNTFTNKNSKVSAHITVDLDGTIIQHVPFNVKAWHAGPSSHMGYNGLNSHSIGIEIVNIGWLRTLADGKLQDAYGNIRRQVDFPHGLLQAPNPRVGSGIFVWAVYPEVQLQAVEELTDTLTDHYHILDIVSHEEIDSRQWKVDPGPAFPMNRMKRHLNNVVRGDDGEKYKITANRLNVRGGPGTHYEALSILEGGAVVDVAERNQEWCRISNDGWVHGSYLQRV